MTPERWQEVTNLFHAVLARDKAERESFLNDACKHDPSLKAEVEALVAGHEQAGSFGEKPLVVAVARCSQCGSELVSEPGLPGLCPNCLLSLAFRDSDAGLEQLLSSGRVLGERYQVLEILGRGGMGEVFRAFDLKLRVDVALKAIRVSRVGSDRAQEMLRREVRSAREVISSNVCRIFDLVVADGEELVSMEYIDGVTLAERLRDRGPLSLQEAREIASQFLSGLEAIHHAGLVHRDFKPENVMITRTGRVVVMDFGLANIPTEELGRTISGTPAYMAPEQARGEGINARADVFSAGVVLAEVLAVGGESGLTRQDVWRAVREEPPRVPDGPWAPVLRQALSANPQARYPSAQGLARALEEVTFRLPGFEQKHPYPGLSAFTADDAEYFFGREVETERLWKKLERPRLLALIGPSGAGKSSFLRAGLLPVLPGTWQAVITTPGNRPFQSLAHALAPLFAGDPEAIQALLKFDEEEIALQVFRRLRQRREHILLVVDQFEELFTINSAQVQTAFARLLGKLVVETDLRVIISLRDDFLLRCQAHEPLAPAFSDVTPLGTLTESALRRALVQPALACGYRFEDDALVDDMIGEVSKERGALPLLAFAASRLWEKRDREHGLLTRAAYREIGGVAGALALHAEATLERIGTDRIPIVREVFRNLVTSQGTRAVREREEVLSVFDVALAGVGDRAQADEVLNALVDARLLNAYTRSGEAGERHHQIEIVHESLLSAWPRLVRWQTQDAEGAQIRDQLRQAAQLWQDRGRPEDLLWSGTAYRDLAIWRERYPGALSSTEATFAKAAEQRAGRRRRRRQLVWASLALAAAIVTITTSILWQRSETSRRQAEVEARRAEAGKLMVMGERELDRYPTAALAYTIKSLELSDTEPGRQLALRVLQRAPVARLARISDGYDSGNAAGESIVFSQNGEWVAWGGMRNAELLRRDGQKRLVLGDYESVGGRSLQLRFAPSNDRLVANRSGAIRMWSIPDGRELSRSQVDDGRPSILRMGIEGFLTLTKVGEQEVVRSWPLGSGKSRLVGSMPFPQRRDATARDLVYAQGRAVYIRSIEDWDAAPRLIAEQRSEVAELTISPDGKHVATSDATTNIEIWSTAARSLTPERRLRSPGTVVGLSYDPTGQWLCSWIFERGHPTLALFDLMSPDGTDPLVVQKGDTNSGGGWGFDPSGRWLVTSHGSDVAFWSLTGPRAHVLRGTMPFLSVQFSPDSQRLFSLSIDRGVREWTLRGNHEPRVVLPAGAPTSPIIFHSVLDPSGRLMALAGGSGRVSVLRIDDGSVRSLQGFPGNVLIGKPAFSEDGRLVAAGLLGGASKEKLVRVWDLATGSIRAIGPLSKTGDRLAGGIAAVSFAGHDRLLASIVGAGIVSIDLNSGEVRTVIRQPIGDIAISHDGRFGVGAAQLLGSQAQEGRSPLLRFDLENGTVRTLSSHGGNVTAIALDPTGSLVATGSFDGTIRVGRSSGEEPHILMGQEGAINSIAFSPDGRWLAASGEEFAIHVWPVPDVSRVPLHRRPHDELLATLRSHTNLRAMPDAASASGYTLEPGPFTGWAESPEW